MRNQNLELISELKTQNELLKTQNELLKTQNLELRNSVNTIISQINSQSQSPIIEEIKSKVNTSEIKSINNNSEGSNLIPSTEYRLSNESLSIIFDQTDILKEGQGTRDKGLKNELPLNKYEGLYARVPVEYAKSQILVGLSENNGYLFGRESGMTKTIKVPLSHVIEYKQESKSLEINP